MGIEDGTVLKEPLIEYCLKDDKLGDPLIAEEHILAFDWASKKEIEKVKKMILRINDFMIGMFRGVGIKLIDFKLEFGRLKANNKEEVILADEISPDTCRLWDSITDKKLDKDRFRKNLGDLNTYRITDLFDANGGIDFGGDSLTSVNRYLWRASPQLL